MKKRTLYAWLCVLLLALPVIAGCLTPALAYEEGTLAPGMEGEEVQKMQQALIDLGYLKGTADGKYGTNTENAVRKFQKKNGLTSDGLAGKKTLELIYQKQKGKASATTPAPEATPTPRPEDSGSSSGSSSGGSSGGSSEGSSGSSGKSSGSSLFGGNYATIRPGDSGDRVKILQKALITLGYLSGTADGKYGNRTKEAVKTFQGKKKLTKDGLAGKKTLQALEKAVANGESGTTDPTASPTQSSVVTLAPDAGKTTGPSKGEIKLLSWFDDIKPNLKSKQTLVIFDPSTSLSWKLRVYSRGRHCDAEPLTAEDTAIMLKAFGGKNTWNQKGVYVKLPSGTWTVGSTHDNPHGTTSIKDNNFSGHLCVHFLRTMEEAEKNDPNYGVSNQRTIRTLWKNLTGEDIDY